MHSANAAIDAHLHTINRRHDQQPSRHSKHGLIHQPKDSTAINKFTMRCTFCQFDTMSEDSNCRTCRAYLPIGTESKVVISQNPALPFDDVQVRPVAKMLPVAPLSDGIQRQFDFSSKGNPTLLPHNNNMEIVVEINALLVSVSTIENLTLSRRRTATPYRSSTRHSDELGRQNGSRRLIIDRLSTGYGWRLPRTRN